MEQVVAHAQAKEQPVVSDFPNEFVKRFSILRELVNEDALEYSLSKVDKHH